MVEANSSYEKSILLAITCGDYSATRGYKADNPDVQVDNLFCPKWDRVRILGEQGAKGFRTLNPQNYTQHDLVCPDVEDIDAIFERVVNETSRCFFAVYYSGHGIIDKRGSRTCIVMSYRNQNNKMYYYPIQEAVEELARKRNMWTFAGLECCREDLPAVKMEFYEKY